MRRANTVMSAESLFDENSFLGSKQFTQCELGQTKRMEIWVSDFKDKGDDFTLYKLYDFEDNLFAERLIKGY